MADKANQLVLEALRRAVADPAGVPLFAAKSGPGLFASTTVARQAAERCKAEELLRVVGVETRGKAVQELVAITPRGLERLLQEQDPRQVLEDFVRAVEGREKQLAELTAAARQAQAHLDALRGLAAAALERIRGTGPTAPPDPTNRILALLEAWHAANAAKDCPLPNLFRQLRAEAPELTVGQFHDALRALHESGRLWLHPWTGPLYDLPEPPLALLVGHEIAYYASPRGSA